MKKGAFAGCVLLTFSLVLAIILLINSMNSHITTTGQYPANTRGNSLICSSDQTYPFTVYDLAQKRNLKIISVFYDDKISSMSLVYELFYDSAEKISASEAHNHAAMNIAFGKDGLGADAYGSTYAKLSDRMRISLYINSDKLDQVAMKYFMISAENTTNIPNKPIEYQENYQRQGFVCELNNN